MTCGKEKCGGCEDDCCPKRERCCPTIIALPRIVRLGPNTTISGTLDIFGPPLILNGIIDASNAIITGISIGDVNLVDANFFGTSIFDGPSIFNDDTTFGDQIWSESTITINNGDTVTAEGDGTLDLTNWTVILPNPNFENVTLTGDVTIDGTLTVNAETTFTAEVEFSADVTLSATVNITGVLNVTAVTNFTNTVTLNNQIWTDGSTITIGPGQTVSIIGGGTLDLTQVTVIFPDPGYNNVTLTGTTTIEDVLNVTATSTFSADVTFSATVNINGTLNINAAVTIDGSLTVNATTEFTADVTLNNQIWTDGSTITIGPGETVTTTGGGTFDMTGWEIIMSGPLELINDQPLEPALQLCQDSPEPTTLDLCNDNPAGGSQITFSGTPGNLPAIESIPADALTPAGIDVMVPVVGGAPVAAISAPPLLAAGVAGAIPVAAAAGAAAGAGGGAAGVAAAAGALAGAAAGAGAIVGVAGIIASPVMALTAVTGGLPALPKGALSLDTLTNDILNGDIPLVGWVPNSGLFLADQTINTSSDNDIPTTKDNDLPASPLDLGPTDPKTIGEPDPTLPATLKVPELILGSTSSPTTLTLVGPCDKESRFEWDCGTGILQLVIFDSTGPSTVVVQQWSELGTTVFSPSFNNTTLTGITTIQDTLNVTALTTFTNSVTLDDQIWTGGSTITISGGGTVTAVGAGTLDLSAWTVIIPSPGFNNVTLTGTTTIQDILIVSAAATFQDGIDLVPQAANPRPGGDPTLWADSVNANAFRYEDSFVMTSATATTAGRLAVSTNTSGVFTTSPVTSATLTTSLLVTATTATPFRVQSTSPSIVIPFYNTSGTSANVRLELGTSTAPRWNVGVDPTFNLSDVFFIKSVAVVGNAITIASNHLVRTDVGLETPFTKYLPVAGQPALSDATSIWVDSGDPTRPRWGAAEQLALLSDIIAPTFNNVTLTGTTTIEDVLVVTAPSVTFDNLITATVGVQAERVDFTTTGGNPGGPTTLWVNSLDDSLFYGDDPVINLANLVTIMGIEDWTGNWTLSSNEGTFAPIVFPVTVSKVRNQVFVRQGQLIDIIIPPSVNVQRITIDVGSMPTSLWPATVTYVRYVGDYSADTSGPLNLVPTLAWDEVGFPDVFYAGQVNPSAQGNLTWLPSSISYTT